MCYRRGAGVQGGSSPLAQLGRAPVCYGRRGGFKGVVPPCSARYADILVADGREHHRDHRPDEQRPAERRVAARGERVGVERVARVADQGHERHCGRPEQRRAGEEQQPGRSRQVGAALPVG